MDGEKDKGGEGGIVKFPFTQTVLRVNKSQESLESSRCDSKGIKTLAFIPSRVINDFNLG